MTLRRLIAVALGLVGLAGSTFAGEADVSKLPPAVGRNVDFVHDVRPLFEGHCYSCHGAEKQKSGYRLDVRGSAMKGGDVGERPIVPGDSAHSPLVQYVAGIHPDITMPPKGEPLTADQIGVLRAWIDQGARWPAEADRIKVADKSDWWSFRPVVRPAVPPGASNPIDAFVLAKLREKKLAPNPPADPRTLIRRVYFDLLGLPPSPEEVEAFVKDSDARAYEKLVDRLLDSPRYGERWGRHWLDAVRYGDTHGYDKDKVRENAWPYRDYLIRAFNSDKPYDRFVREQIAGDSCYPGTTDGIVALGFIAAGPWDYVGQVELREGTIDKSITRNLDRDDMVTVTMNTFTSLTAQCARCHDHKFDPIRQEDYYSLQAVFAGVDRADRSYEPGDDVAAVRKALQGRLDARKARRAEIEGAIARAAGPELATIDAKMAELTAVANSDGRRPEYGYHSQISPRQDAVKWVQVDLGGSTAIERILLAGCDDDFNNIGAGFGFPVRYRVEVSDDPRFKGKVTIVADRTEADVANPGTRPQVIEVGGKVGRYVRVTATKLAPRKDDFIFALAELEVVTPDGVDVARGKEVAALDSIEAPVRWRKSNVVDGYYPGQARKVSEAELATLRARRQAILDRAMDEPTRRRLDRAVKEVSAIEGQLKALPPTGVVYAAASEFAAQGSFEPTRGRPRPVYLLQRGSEKSPGREVGPGTVAFAHVPALPSRFDLSPQKDEAARRAALADWIVDARNPLTWRSIVNRVWQEHFGRGIVETPNDFGHMGALPSHPELLDWLACEFRDGGKFLRARSIKQLHRLILTSDTYRQSCADNAGDAQIDSGNLYLWRMNRTRLDAEAVRDSILAVSGQLDLTTGGPGFRDFGFKDDHSPHYTYAGYDPDAPGTHRRSVYRMIVRSVPDPFMETLDCADPSQIVARRNETLTPLQALALLNDPFVVRMTEHFAERLRRTSPDIVTQIDTACRLAFGRSASDLERRTLAALAREHGLASACRIILNANAFIFVD